MLQQKPIGLLLVDREDIVRYGLRSILNRAPSVEVLGEASNGKEAIAQARRLRPDVIIMDVDMPVMDGLTATGEICQMLPDTKVLILTNSSEEEHMHNAIRQGATGYIIKTVIPENFVRIIQSVHTGYIQLEPSVGRRLYQQFSSLAANKQSMNLKGVTPREKEVLHLIGQGANNREISQKLNIAEKTVKNHVSSLLSRLCLRDRTQLAIWINTNRIATCVTNCFEKNVSIGA